MTLRLGSIDINITFNVVLHSEASLTFVVTGSKPIPHSPRVNPLRGLKVAYQLKDNYTATLKLQGKSMHGNPVDFTTEQINCVSSDPTIITVTEQNGEITVTPVGPLGTAQVQVTIPSVQVNGAPLGGNFDVQIIAGDPDSIQFTPETTTIEPDPNAGPTVPPPPPPVANP